MKRVFSVMVLLILILMNYSYGQDNEILHRYSSISEALEFSYKSQGRRPNNLPELAIEYLVEQLSLDWEIKRISYSIYNVNVRAYVSENLLYCILVNAPIGERGQIGPAKYCLIDSLGNIYWQLDKYIVSAPAISNNGNCALIYPPEGNFDWKAKPVTVELISSTGELMLAKTWDKTISRGLPHAYFGEFYGFANDCSYFYMTLNVPLDSVIVFEGKEVRDNYNNSELFIFDLTEMKSYNHCLEDFNPRIGSHKNDHDVILEGSWQRFFKSYPWYQGYYVISDNGKRISKKIFEVHDGPIRFNK